MISNDCRTVGVITDIDGLALTREDREFLIQPEITGLIFFARNYESPQQLSELTRALRELRPDLLLTVDQEGGRVQRFRDGFSRFAPMLRYEPLYRDDPDLACELARTGGWLLATELIMRGVDLTFAPVLDVERDLSEVIGDRAFGHSASVVTTLASAWCDGLAEAGMKAVGKHFPGHGAVKADSHLELPVDPRERSDLDYDIQPFADLIAAGKINGIMPAHVVYPAVDQERTAGFSSVWLQQILRQQLGFDGVIFSDDLSMEGAASGGDFYQRSFAAAEAGANALVVCNNRGAATEVVRAVNDMFNEGAQPLSLSDWQLKEHPIDNNRLQQARARLLHYGLLTESAG